MSAPSRPSALANGVPVVVRSRPGADVTTVSVWVRLGSRHETAPGITHLLEHVLTQAVPPGRTRRVVDELEALGADANALTSRDHLALYARVPSPDAAAALRVLADAVTNTDFPAELVDAERRVVDEELRLAATEPGDVVHDVFFETAFAGQPMGRPVGGTRADVAKLTPADVEAWARAEVTTGTVAVVASGDLTDDDVVATLRDGPLAALRDGSRPAEDQAKPTHGRVDHALNNDTAAVIVGGHGYALDDPRLPVADVVLELLAGANASVLHEELRSARGLTYDLWGGATGYRDAGVWRIGMSTAPEHRDTVVDLARELIADAVARGFTAAEVDVARRRAAALLRLDAESTLDEALQLGRRRLIGGVAGWTLQRHAEALARVEATDVAGCAREMTDRLVVATAGGSG